MDGWLGFFAWVDLPAKLAAALSDSLARVRIATRPRGSSAGAISANEAAFVSTHPETGYKEER